MVMPEWWRDVRFRSIMMVYLASVMEKADEAVLPAVYREIGVALHASPSALGSLTLVRYLTQDLFSPVAALLAQQYDRATIISAGAVMWSIATFFVGISTTFSQVAISRAVNGIGLAIVGPAIHSLIADATHDNNRGQAFGWLGVAGRLGSIIGGFFPVMMADATILGVAGWRMAFHLVAAMSVVVGALVYLYAVDPQFSTSAAALTSRKETGFRGNLKVMLIDAKNVIRIKSFQLLVAQGVAGSLPWAALSFSPMWLELIGFSNRMTAVLMGYFVVSTSLGGLFGGFVGDYLSIRLPNTGRIILSQISTGLGVPLGAILFLALPYSPSRPFLYAIIFTVMGLCISWNPSSTNGPILAEIVPDKSRTNVFALDKTFAVLAAFSPAIVGLLAEKVYGYVPPVKGKDSLAIDKQNAVALAKALYAAIGLPFAVCGLIYTGLYWTYPRDRDRVREFQMDFQTDAFVPLEDFTIKGQNTWILGDSDEDEKDKDELVQKKDDASIAIPEEISERERLHSYFSAIKSTECISRTEDMRQK